MKNSTSKGLVLLALVGLTLNVGCDAPSDGDDDGAATAAGTGMGPGGGSGQGDGGGTEGGSGDDGDDDDNGAGDETADGADEDSGGSDSPTDVPTDDDAFALVGPSGDPAPDRTESGAYDCDGCSQTMMDTNDESAGDAPSFELTGTTVGHDQPGRFYVEGPDGQFAGGMLLPDDGTGMFLQNVPLFCGDNTIKALFHSDSGTAVYVKHVERTGCMAAAVRATLAWEDTSQEWNLHLVRFGGMLQGDGTDCYDSFDCDGSFIDWGTEDVVTDNPHADVDPWLQYAGVANVTVTANAEDGMTVAVDNIDDSNGGFPRGIVYINVAGGPTQVVPIDGLPNFEVFVAATIDGAAGSSTVIAEQSDCAANWSDGCVGSLP